MAMKLTDKLKAPSRSSVDAVYAWAASHGAKRLPDLREYLEGLWDYSEETGYDFSILAAQSAHETVNWTSAAWVNKLNPAGLAITGVEGGPANDLSSNLKNGTNAARAQLVHMTGYVDGRIDASHPLYQYRSLDPHYDAIFTTGDEVTGAPLAKSVKTLGDFNVEGRWAITGEKPYYGSRILNKANEIFPNLPAQGDVSTPSTPEGPVPDTVYNYDNGMPPAWIDYKVSESAKFAGYISPADHFIAACVWHSAYGTLQGTTGWYQGGNALTDTMVGNTLDGAALDGQVRRFNDAYGPRYAHSSGPVSNPIDDAAKFLEIFGPNPSVINMYTTAMERSCTNSGSPAVSAKERAARVWWTAYHANRYGKRIKERTGKDGLTCDTFPLVTTENNRSFIIYHGEINDDKRNSCPDQNVRADIDLEITQIRALLAKWQKGGATVPPVVDPLPTYAPAKPIEALQAYKDKDAAPAYVKVGNDIFTFVNDRVKTTKKTPRYQSANTDGKKIGPDIEKDTEFAVLWFFWDDKQVPWYITPYWTRVLVADTQRISDTA